MDEQGDRLRALADDNERLRARLRQARALETVGSLAGGVTHELNNLLMTIGGNAERVLADVQESDPAWKAAGTITRATERAAWLTRQLLRLGHQEPQPPRAIDVDRLLAQQVKLLRRVAGAGVQVSIAAAGPSQPVTADEGLVEHLLLRVAALAREALPRGGRLAIETARDEAAAKPRVRLAVRLEGTAVEVSATEALRCLLENVSEREAPVSVESGDGWLAVELRLPAAPAATPDPVGLGAEVRGHGTVLLVDGEDDARDVLAAAIGAGGYRVLEARNAGEALLLAEREPVDLLVSDVVLPILRGVDLFDRLSRARPGLAVVFVSSGAGRADREEAASRGAVLLAKPFATAVLLAAVRKALA